MSTAENKDLVRQYFEVFHNERQLDIGEQHPRIGAADAYVGCGGHVAHRFSRLPDHHRRSARRGGQSRHCLDRDRHPPGMGEPGRASAATGKAVTWTGTTTLRVVEGKIAEVIGTNWDHLGILQQLGALP